MRTGQKALVVKSASAVSSESTPDHKSTTERSPSRSATMPATGAVKTRTNIGTASTMPI